MNDSESWNAPSLKDTVIDMRRFLNAFDEALGEEPHRNNPLSHCIRETILKQIELLETVYFVTLDLQLRNEIVLSDEDQALLDDQIDAIVDFIEEQFAELQARHPEIKPPE